MGTLNLPDSTSEAEWAEKLSAYVINPSEVASRAVRATVKQRKDYADDLMERFKQNNISQGINGLQGLWLHHRMRALPVTFMGMNFVIDVMNLIVSGDLEIAVLTLSYCTDIDDGSQPHHWFTVGRRDWIVSEIKTYLGWA